MTNIFDKTIFDYNYGLGSSVGGVSPLKVLGLKMWLDMADESTISDTSGAVDSVSDKSGNGNDATETGANRPTTGTRTENGKNVLDFNGSASRLIVEDSPDFNHSGAGFTLITVAVVDSYAAGSEPLVAKFQNNLGEELRFASNNFNNFGLLATLGLTSTTDVIVTTGIAPTDGEAFFAGVVYEDGGVGAPIVASADPVNAANNLSIPESTQPIYIGNIRGTSEYLDGAICEVLWYDRKLTNAEIDYIGNYLKAKWGVPYITQNQTEFTIGAGQSNMQRPLETANGFDEEGRTIYNDTLGTYFSSTKIFDAAFNRSAILQANTVGNWWIDNDLTDGPGVTGLIDNLDSVGEVATPLEYWDSVIWAGGDADIIGITDADSTKAEVKAAFEQLVTRFRALMDGTSNKPIIIALNGRYTTSLMDDASAQAVRDMFMEVAAADSNIHTVEAYDAALSDSTHWTVASAEVIFERMAEKVAFARGKRPEAGTLGPIITSATYSGTTVTAQVELDQGSAISGSEPLQFRVEDDGSAVAVNSISISGTTLTLTLASSIASGSTVELWCNYGRGATVTPANLVKDANGLVMRSVSALSVTEA